MSTSNPVPTFTTNAAELSKKLNSMAGKIEDPRGLLERVRAILQAQELHVFASDGAALEGAWKAIVNPDRKIGSQTLVETSALLTSVVAGGSIRGTTLRIHPRPFYSRFHQFGTARMDARPFTGISDETMRLIYDEFERATGEALT